MSCPKCNAQWWCSCGTFTYINCDDEAIQMYREQIYQLEQKYEAISLLYMDTMEENRKLKGLLRESFSEIDLCSYDFGSVNMNTSLSRCLSFLDRPDIKEILGKNDE